MICKKYTFTQHPTGQLGVETLITRQEELVEGTLAELQQNIMMDKLAGKLGGYQIYDYNSKQEYLDANHLDYDEMSKHLVEQDFDKAAMVDTNISWAKDI